MKKNTFDIIKGNCIAFIGQKGIPAEFVGTSGVEFYVEDKALQLVKKNKKVVCYVRPWTISEKVSTYKGITIINIPSINTKHLDAITHSFLSTVHASLSPVDTIWYQAIGPAFFSPLAKLFGKHVIVTIHGLDWKRNKWNSLVKSIIKTSEYVLTLFADDIIVVSKELEQYYATAYKKTVYLDSPTTIFYKHTQANIIKRKYQLTGNDYVLYMGRFVPEKRIEWIIRAFNKIRNNNYKLVLAGGSSHSEKYVNYLHKLSQKNTSIIFTGYVFGKEKAELLSNCALFILTSSVEGNSIVLNEVIGHGKRILASENIVKNLASKTRCITYTDNDYDNFLVTFSDILL